jgi:hypothetical protein
MILSTNNDLGEYDLIRRPAHISCVWKAIEKSLPKYWDRLAETTDVGRLAAKFGTPSLQAAQKQARAGLVQRFAKAISDYEKDAEKYRTFLNDSTLEECRDDPNSFKQLLSKDVPVIANALHQRSDTLREWQGHFRRARGRDLLEMFANMFDFISEWKVTHPTGSYGSYDAPEQFALDPLDTDETMKMENVIGMGIRSIVLFHLDPERFPSRNRTALYGLYFLSEKQHFSLPSHSSEFLMIDDQHPASNGSFVMEYNYWYPYGIFSLYALRIFRWMQAKGDGLGISLKPAFRYVYVRDFLDDVCSHHTEDMKVMRAHDRFGVPD